MSELRVVGPTPWGVIDGVPVVYGPDGPYCILRAVDGQPRLETPTEYAQRRAREDIDRATGRR